MHSMTGYGRARVNLPQGAYVMELKTVNHRFLDFFFRLPPNFMEFDFPLRKLVGQFLSRGRVELNLSREAGSPPEVRPTLNKEMASAYVEIVADLNRLLGRSDPPSADTLLKLKDIMSFKEPSPEETWAALESGMRSALTELAKSREEEGRAMARDFAQRISTLEDYLKEVEAASEGLVEHYRERLSRRIEKLLNGAEADSTRLWQEATFLAERSDITEEIVRLRSHLNRFREIMASGGVIGKKLDFLNQEMSREVNTIGSKAGDTRIINIVVEMKNEIEKIREQVQNVE